MNNKETNPTSNNIHARRSSARLQAGFGPGSRQHKNTEPVPMVRTRDFDISTKQEGRRVNKLIAKNLAKVAIVGGAIVASPVAFNTADAVVDHGFDTFFDTKDPNREDLNPNRADLGNPADTVIEVDPAKLP